MRERQMKVMRGTGDDTFTEYVFYHGGYEDHRRYLNLRLRNRVEELIRIYLSMAEMKVSIDDLLEEDTIEEVETTYMNNKINTEKTVAWDQISPA